MTDLTAAKSTIESLMLDQCSITLDVEGTHDDVLDPATLRLSRPVNDTTTVYAGRCSVYPEGGQGGAGRANVAVEGGGQKTLLSYIVAIPAAAAIPPVGAVVHITTAADPGLKDAVLRVTAVIGRTRVVVRKLRCELRERITDRP